MTSMVKARPAAPDVPQGPDPRRSIIALVGDSLGHSLYQILNGPRAAGGKSEINIGGKQSNNSMFES